MKKISRRFVTLCLIIGLYIQCSDDETNNITLNRTENTFVWEAMNLWYLYQDQVPNLADRDLSEAISFADGFSSPDVLFDNLLLSPPGDRFSSITSNFETLLNSLQGRSLGFGHEFTLYLTEQGSNEVFGFVEYVVPGSPADLAGIERGDLFRSVDGTLLNRNNINALLRNISYTLGLADFDNGNYTLNGIEVNLTAVEFTENPILLSTVIEEQGVKIGYLVYNSFSNNFNSDLNSAIGQLASEGITELVLDLRYNGGGSVLSAQYLGSMITGDFVGQPFATLNYNDKLNGTDNPELNLNTTYNFVTQTNEGLSLNTLGLDHLYVLTTRSSASASEMVINSLSPYIEVTTIGTTTTGKNVGQNILFDSPNNIPRFSSLNSANPNHRWALLPVTFSYFNSQGDNNFADGISPNPENVVNELQFLGNILPLGNIQEPLLRRAINLILGSQMGNPTGIPHNLENLPGESVFSSRDQKVLGNSMYLEDPIFLNP